MDLSRPDHDAPAEGDEARLPFGLISLEEAAQRLDVSRQGLVDLLSQAGIPIQRVSTRGRNVSAVDRLDLHRVRPSNGARLEDPGSSTLWAKLQARAAAQHPEDEPTRERLRQVQAELAEARAELQLAEKGEAQRERLGREAAAAQTQIVELTRALGSLEASLASAREQLTRREAELADVRRRAQEERDGLVSELEEVRARDRSTRDELRGTSDLRDALAKQLQLARQVEAANQAYLDRIEQQLSAARHTADHLRRRRA